MLRQHRAKLMANKRMLCKPSNLQGRQIAKAAKHEGLGRVPGDTSKTFMLGGFGDLPALQIGWFAKHSFIGHQLCAMLAQHWFINKACYTPARDAMRNGYDISIPSAPGEKDNKDDPQRTAI